MEWVGLSGPRPTNAELADYLLRELDNREEVDAVEAQVIREICSALKAKDREIAELTASVDRQCVRLLLCADHVNEAIARAKAAESEIAILKQANVNAHRSADETIGNLESLLASVRTQVVEECAKVVDARADERADMAAKAMRREAYLQREAEAIEATFIAARIRSLSPGEGNIKMETGSGGELK